MVWSKLKFHIIFSVAMFSLISKKNIHHRKVPEVLINRHVDSIPTQPQKSKERERQRSDLEK